MSTPPMPPPPPGGPAGYGGYGGYPAGGQGPKPDNYLVWAILTTILCCLPAGIVSIVYAAKVDGLYNGGQYSQALEASNNAKKWAIISAVVGIVGSVIGGIFYFVILGVSLSNY